MRGVAVHAHRHGLDQRRALAGERALARDADGLEHRLAVVAVDLHAREAVGRRALDRVDRELLVERRRVRVLVVLEDEDHRAGCWTPAQFIASWKSPREVEPSPNQVIATRCSPRSLNAIASPVAISIMSGSIETIPTQPLRAVAEVHVAVAAAGDAALAAHVLGEDARGLDAADDVGGEVAVQDAEAVLRGHRPRGAGRHGLLAEAVVERAGDLALAVERHRALLDAAHHQHRAQEPDPVLGGQVLRYVRRDLLRGPGLCRFSRHVACSLSSVGASGILRPALLAWRPARGLRAGAPKGTL